jgi:hypothetical protein
MLLYKSWLHHDTIYQQKTELITASPLNNTGKGKKRSRKRKKIENKFFNE